MKTWKHTDRIAPLPNGPWDDEPDKAQWVDEPSGLDCLIVRNRFGALCGYVGVGPDHPYHGKDYADLYDLDVHGGLTFAASCDEEAPEGHGICHIPEPGRPKNVWWLGFDCAHFTDLCPAAPHASETFPEVYRNFAYVQSECAALAVQLAEVGRSSAGFVIDRSNVAT